MTGTYVLFILYGVQCTLYINDRNDFGMFNLKVVILGTEGPGGAPVFRGSVIVVSGTLSTILKQILIPERHPKIAKSPKFRIKNSTKMQQYIIPVENVSLFGTKS